MEFECELFWKTGWKALIVGKELLDVAFVPGLDERSVLSLGLADLEQVVQYAVGCIGGLSSWRGLEQVSL